MVISGFINTYPIETLCVFRGSTQEADRALNGRYRASWYFKLNTIATMAKTIGQKMLASGPTVGFVVLASALTGLIGEAIIKVIETTFLHRVPHAQIEDLFGHLELVALALALVGILILVAGIADNRRSIGSLTEANDLNATRAGIVGAVQGLCLPFRGFSRSGATISVAMLLGVSKARAEMFSFALAVVLTPVVVAREVMRVVHAEHATGTATFASAAFPSVLGAFFAFLAGLIALKWLSRWLEGGRWYLFGIYCLIVAMVIGYLHHLGY